MQKPEYYVIKTLVDSETHYLPLEKMALALVHATRKLPHYFHPLQSLLRKSYFTGRIAKWGTILGSFNVRYKSRNAIKG